MGWHDTGMAMLTGFCLAAAAGSAAAQNRLLFDPGDMRYQSNSGPVAAPAPATPRGAAPAARAAKPAAESIGAAPARQVRTPPKDPPAAPALGRGPSDHISVGLETSTKIKPDKLPDGSPIPGMQSDRRPDNSPFLGLSVKVPTN
jgi:hypothetical protein